MDRDEDFLDEIIRERAAVNPEFPAMVEAELERRRARRLQAGPECDRSPNDGGKATDRSAWKARGFTYPAEE